MARNETYGGLQRAIADELQGRQDLLQPLNDSGLSLSPIQNAIQSAIAKWEREPFYFNEFYDDPLFSTGVGQEYYSATTSPVAVSAFADIPKITKLRVMLNGNRYTLVARSWQYIEDVEVNAAAQTSLPFDFAYFAGTLRLYPIPSEVVTVTVMDNKRLGALANDSDSNAWTTEAYDLIRSEAKLILAQEVLFDDDLAGRMRAAIYGDAQQTHGYLYGLRAETSRRGGGGKIRPTRF